MTKSTTQLPGCLPKGCNLDSLLTPEQFCIWQQAGQDWFKRKKSKLAGVIKMGRNMTRVHPRSYLEKGVKS